MNQDFFENTKEAFSLQSLFYDDYEAKNSTLKFMRNEVRKHVITFLRDGDKILELNAGTGMDAVFFAKNGFKVHATDISGGMISQLKYKVEKNALEERVTIQQCSYTELDKVTCGPFDYIFSNFGGLNCSPDLNQVTRFFPDLLNKNGRITLVLMPPVCPWEIALMFCGHFKTAVRRFKKGGITAHIEGKYFDTFYYTPGQVIKALGNRFKKLKLQGLASFTPPPYINNFPQRYSELYKKFIKFDKYFSNYFPFNCCADHFIITAEYIQIP
jgi:ubiquinone/menaquinone biosynthesis C-methylase UbiE